MRKIQHQLRNKAGEEEFCLLGVDVVPEGGQDSLRIGLVLKLLYGTQISLDGDGGFSLEVLSQHLIFKPRCLQDLWVTLQLLHSVTASLEPVSGQPGSDWISQYKSDINSPQSCVNEWNEMPDISVRVAAFSLTSRNMELEELLRWHLTNHTM